MSEPPLPDLRRRKIRLSFLGNKRWEDSSISSPDSRIEKTLFD